MEDKNQKTSLEQCKKLLTEIAIFQKENVHRRMVTAREFSVFGPGLLQLKETTASRILAHLLDPAGAHAQGPFFLRRVFRLLPALKLAKEDTSRVSVSLEQVTYGDSRPRRVDILLEGHAFVVGIENKLGAGTGKDQLTDYLDWLRRYAGNRSYYLVYLTPHGEDAGEWALSHEARVNHDGHFLLLSWRNLLDVLQECAGQVPPRISYFIEDFCKAIEIQKLGGSMNDNDDEVVRYLTSLVKTDELRVASALFQSYKKMSDRIVHEWIIRLKNALEPKVSGVITIAEEVVHEAREVDYLQIDWEDWRISIKVVMLPYAHGHIAAHTIFWGEMIWRWTFEHQDPSSDPWIIYLMDKSQTKKLTGNFLTMHKLSAPTDVDLLNTIHDTKELYLFKDLLAASRRVEDLRTEWEKTLGQAGA